MIAAALVTNGDKALTAYTLMAQTFKLIGDVMPNSEEIHLEAMGATIKYHNYVYPLSKLFFTRRQA